VSTVREHQGCTQRELAERAQISVTFLSEVENDKRNVSSEVLLRLADALGASLDYLLRGEENAGNAALPVAIPAALAAAAEEHGWPFSETVALLHAYRAVLARRGRGGGAREWDAEDWVNLHAHFYGDG
jgi:transcriptional regulator with XRE-family HTH domain